MAAANPVLLFAYANDRQDDHRYMRNLPEERRAIEAALRGIEDAGTVDVVHCPNATIDEVLAKCQRCGDRLAVFHFAGHADGKTLLFEQRDGSPAVSHARSIAEFLATFGGLKLVVLNGCSTQEQVESLLALGIPAVIATSTLVRDDVATSFAGHLYTALAAGETVETAFRRASSAVVVQYTTGTDGALSALCRDVGAENRTISLPSLWDLHGTGARQFRLIASAAPIGAVQPGSGARDAGARLTGNVHADAGSSTPSRRRLPRVVAALAAVLVAVVGYFAFWRPGSVPAPAREQKPEELAETVKLVALLAQVPDRGVRIELLKKITGKKELDRDLVAQVEAFELVGTKTADYQIRLEAQQARALDTAGATRVLQSGPSVAGLPCRGQLDFEVRDGLLACKNGVPIAAVTTPNTGGALAEVKLIVFHSTETEGLASTMRFMQDPQRPNSVHLLIDRDGTVVQMVRFDRIAWHAGSSQWKQYGVNGHSIGIQLVNLGALSPNGTMFTRSSRSVPADEIGTAANGSQWQTFTPSQIAVATAIAKVLARTYPIEDIVGHCHVQPDRRVDPGPLFPFAELVPAVLGRPFSLPPCGASPP